MSIKSDPGFKLEFLHVGAILGPQIRPQNRCAGHKNSTDSLIRRTVGCPAATPENANPAIGVTLHLSAPSNALAPPVSVPASRASCYDAAFELPAALQPGNYSAVLQNSLGGTGGAFSLDVLRPAHWPPRVFPVSKSAGISAALAAAAAAGGGVVTLAPGRYDLGGASLALAHNVQLVGAGEAELAWTKPTHAPLVA